MNHWNEKQLFFKCTDVSVPVRIIIISRGCVEQLNDSMLNKEGLYGLCDELCVLFCTSPQLLPQSVSPLGLYFRFLLRFLRMKFKDPDSMLDTWLLRTCERFVVPSVCEGNF